MNISTYISNQPVERQALLQQMHETIIAADKTVTAKVAPMMGKDMIIYSADVFKYGLSSMKNYMSLHVMAIYGSPNLFTKYKALFPNANFQKGCINFKNAAEMPLEIVVAMIKDCAPFDLLKIREEYLKNKKAKNRK